MERVYFAHSQVCTDGVPHAESVVAALRSELEVVTWLNHDGVTAASLGAFLDQCSDPRYTKDTLVVIDAPALDHPMEVLGVVHARLPDVPTNVRFLVLLPLLPSACVFCECHTHFV